jgi:hypothetical protein
VEVNSSHYIAICIEDDSRSQVLYCQLGDKLWLSCFFHTINIGVYVSGPENIPLPVELKVWKTIPFVEDTLVSGAEAVNLLLDYVRTRAHMISQYDSMVARFCHQMGGQALRILEEGMIDA